MKARHCTVGELASSSVFRHEAFRPATDHRLLAIRQRASYSRLFSTWFKMVLMNIVEYRSSSFS